MRSSRGTDGRGTGQDDPAARRLALLAADLRQSVRPADEGPAPTWPPAEAGWWADHTRVAARPEAEQAGHGRPATPSEVGETGPGRRATAAWGAPSHDLDDVAPPLPRPGRHAARRGRGWEPPSPSWFGPPQLAVVAVVVAAALGLGAWWLARSQAEVADPSAAAPATAAPLVAAPTSSTASPSDVASVTVDVTGRVRRPGIVVLDPGARVVDALEAAGGARPGVDLAGLNLARVLVDGEQIVVGEPSGSQPGAAPGGVPPPAGGSSGAPSSPAALVNLNLATAAELETLPDVGPVTAAAIIAWRDEHGGFTSVDQLLDVDGIGEATLATLAPHVTV